MAENKKSFLLYADLISTVAKLPDVKAGKLFKLILQYVNDENPQVEDLILQVAFEPIKQQLKRDLVKWDVTKGERSESGRLGNLKRWNKDLYDQVTAKELSIEKAEEIAKNRIATKRVAKIAVNDNVNVNVSVRESDAPTLFKIEECLAIALRDDRWVRANKTSKEELEEFNRLLEKRSVYEKNPGDYKSHFSNWKTGGKLEESFSKSGNNPPPKMMVI
jgi:Ulp1 family protease